MRLIYTMGTEDVAMACLYVFVIFIGAAIARVGLYGEHLGRFKLVSSVRKDPDQPSVFHRCVTVGIGIVASLSGVALLIFQFIVLNMKAELNPK
jgi:hypothetical protein